MQRLEPGFRVSAAIVSATPTGLIQQRTSRFISTHPEQPAESRNSSEGLEVRTKKTSKKKQPAKRQSVAKHESDMRWVRVHRMVMLIQGMVPERHLVNSDNDLELTPFLVGCRVGLQEAAQQLTEGNFTEDFEVFINSLAERYDAAAASKGKH